MISVFGSKVGEEEINAVAGCMRSQWMGFGKKVNEFEEAFGKKFSVPNFLMVDSGSNALYMACVLLDLPRGSEIILPSFTWVSCAQAVLMAGHRPVFCDVEPDTMNVTAETIQPHITSRTGAIMVVHYAGKPVNMDPILALGYPVIEDAAHAVCSTYQGKHCGTMGEIGIFSFDAVKNLTTGEGGGISFRDSLKKERAATLRYCGIGKSGFDSAASNPGAKWWEYRIEEPFIKMLPTNIAASIGIEQLKKIEDLQSLRKKYWDIYTSELSSVGAIKLPVDAVAGEQHSYFTYVIRIPARNELAKYLYEKGIYTTLRYHPLHLNALYGSREKLVHTEKLNEEALSIPLHPNLKEPDLEHIISSIRAFFRKK